MISNVNRKEAVRASSAGRRLVTETAIVLRLALNLDHSQALRAARERNLSIRSGRRKITQPSVWFAQISP